jgi:hypothetical protein
MGFGSFLDGLPVVGGMAKGAYDAVSGVPGDAYDDYMNNGKNRYNDPGFQFDPSGQNNAQQGYNQFNDRSTQAFNDAMTPRGPQAVEDAGLSQNFNNTFTQQGNAVALAAGAANGTAPSAAQGQLQSGLNQAIAQQQSLAGSARGSAGIALAANNQGGNVANLSQNAVNQSAILRANEMAQARDLYGNLANQQTTQAGNRLNLSNQNNQFNAQLNDQYKIGMSNVSNAYGQTGLGYNNSFNAGQQQRADVYNAQQDRSAGVQGSNAAMRKANSDRIINTATGLGNTSVTAASSNSGPQKQ